MNLLSLLVSAQRSAEYTQMSFVPPDLSYDPKLRTTALHNNITTLRCLCAFINSHINGCVLNVSEHFLVFAEQLPDKVLGNEKTINKTLPKSFYFCSPQKNCL